MAPATKRPLSSAPAPVVCIDDGGHRQSVFAARDALVEKYLCLVDPIARRLKSRLPPSFDLDDLIAAGRVALMRAATRYRPGTHGEAPFAAYARMVIQGGILDAVRRRHYAENTRPSVQSPTVTEPSAPFRDPVVAIDAVRLRARIEIAIMQLPTRERAVMAERYSADEPTLEIVARRLRISKTRAVQLHSSALDKLRDLLKAAV